jgi:hypothetical protein
VHDVGSGAPCAATDERSHLAHDPGDVGS